MLEIAGVVAERGSAGDKVTKHPGSRSIVRSSQSSVGEDVAAASAAFG